MELAPLLEQLTRELDIPMPEMDAKGQYRLDFDADQPVVFYALSSGIALQTELAACPGSNQEAFFSELMLANLFGQGTSRGVLGLTPDGKHLTLSLIIEYNVEYKDFRDLLEDFLNAADVWRSEAAKANQNG